MQLPWQPSPPLFLPSSHEFNSMHMSCLPDILLSLYWILHYSCRLNDPTHQLTCALFKSNYPFVFCNMVTLRLLKCCMHLFVSVIKTACIYSLILPSYFNCFPYKTTYWHLQLHLSLQVFICNDKLWIWDFTQAVTGTLTVLHTTKFMLALTR